jgi:hypothetical protein
MHAFIPGRRANDSMSSGAVDSGLFEHLWAFGRVHTAPVHRARGSNHVDIGNLVQRSALLRASRRTATGEIVPASILRDAALRAAPLDEVGGLITLPPIQSV